MSSRDSSRKRADSAVEPLVAESTGRPEACPEASVRSIEEFVEFLAACEAVFGPAQRPRPPTTGERFLL